MTKKQLKYRFLFAGSIYLLAVVMGIVIRYYDNSEKTIFYTTYKDMIPFLIAIPAAWLGYCLQRRSSYLQQLRTLWTNLIEAVHTSIQYTRLKDQSEDKYHDVLLKMSCAIDEVRGVFINIETDKIQKGLYPFEPIKDIFFLLEKINPNINPTQAEMEDIRNKILVLWSDVREELLKEFDREEPTFSHSHWINLEKYRVYEKNGINKTVS